MNIYQLTNEYKSIEIQLLNEDCDQDIFLELLNGVKSDIKDKIINYVFVIKNFENAYNGITDAIILMEKRRDRIYDKIEALKTIALKSMIETEVNKIESEYFNVSVRNNTSKVVIDDQGIIPSEFIRIRETREPDKIKIKEFLSTGEILEGAHLESSKSLQIK
jgi:hypothetical protein